MLKRTWYVFQSLKAILYLTKQKGKYGGARVNFKPAAPGTGVIAGGAVRAVLEAVGVHDVLSKSQGSSNPHNVVKATFDALLQLRDANAIASKEEFL